jgi:hypothetical protein
MSIANHEIMQGHAEKKCIWRVRGPPLRNGSRSEGRTTLYDWVMNMDMLLSQSHPVQASTDTVGPENGRDDGSL